MTLKILITILMGLSLTTNLLSVEPTAETISVEEQNRLENRLVANAFSIRYLREFEAYTQETQNAIARLEQERQELLNQLPPR